MWKWLADLLGTLPEGRAYIEETRELGELTPQDGLCPHCNALMVSNPAVGLLYRCNICSYKVTLPGFDADGTIKVNSGPGVNDRIGGSDAYEKIRGHADTLDVNAWKRDRYGR